MSGDTKPNKKWTYEEDQELVDLIKTNHKKNKGIINLDEINEA